MDKENSIDKTQSSTEQVDDELDELLEEFQNMDISVSPETQNSIVPLKDLTKEEDLEKFVNDNTQELITSGMTAVKNLIQDAQASGDPELIASVSRFSQTLTSSLELLNKQVLKNKDIKSKLEIEKLKRDESVKQGLDEVKGFISDRENAFKSILEDLEYDQKNIENDSTAIDVEEY